MTFTDQFFRIDPSAPPPAGTSVALFSYVVNDKQGDGVISSAGGNGDSVNGSDIRSMYPGDTLTLNVGGTIITYTGVTMYLADGSTVFTPTDGKTLQAGTFVSSTSVTQQGTVPVSSFSETPIVACFTVGTMIAVPGGEVAIETLRVGDAVLTLDHGAQTIRWIGRHSVSGQGRHVPVAFEPGTVGNRRRLLVSPLHRMLIRGWRAELHFGSDGVLVCAKHLVGAMAGVQFAPQAEVEYIHLLFDRHEIVFVEGAPSESFHPGSILLESDLAMRDEIFELFPELASRKARKAVPAARPFLRARDVGLLCGAAGGAPGRGSAFASTGQSAASW